MTEYELERIPTDKLPKGTTIYVWYPDYSRQYSLRGLLFGDAASATTNARPRGRGIGQRFRGGAQQDQAVLEFVWRV